MLDLVILTAGFVPLILGASWLVDGSSSIAKRFNIPSIVIGLTIVAFGTSSPELIVNILASVSGNSDIVLGNVLGSNMFNILAILGISSIIYSISVKSNTTWIEIPLCLLSSIILITIANDSFIDKSPASVISRIDGIILLIFFLIFLVYNFQVMKSGPSGEDFSVRQYSLSKSLLMIGGGLLLLITGGRIIVVSAINFAHALGISERIIGLTIVSVGTSLPELATSIVAASKKNVDIAIGNIVGSNIFNVFFILGSSSVIRPVRVQSLSHFDMQVNIAASLLLFIFIFTGKGRKIERWEGVALLVFYVLYISSLIIL